MANQVFANGLEISCKSAGGKSIACTPDVCFTPGPPPPGVPVPYPNTAMSSDTTQGSKTVKITGKETMLRNKSCFKTSTGDEAGSAPKKGTVTSKIKGKTYFSSWSMDVKIEGENAVRHTDIMTHNHGSFPGNTPTWPYLDEAALSDAEGPCKDDIEKEKTACSQYDPHTKGGGDPCKILEGWKKPSREKSSPEAHQLADVTAADDCLAARRCALQPYNEDSKCCYPQTGHHLIAASAFFGEGRGGADSIPITVGEAGGGKIEPQMAYDETKAPCVCAEGPTQNVGTHGMMHTLQSADAALCDEGSLLLSNGDVLDTMKIGRKTVPLKVTTYGAAKESAVEAMKTVFPESACKEDCIRKQLDNYHNQCGVDDDSKIKAVVTGKSSSAAKAKVIQDAKVRSDKIKAAKLANKSTKGKR